MVGTNHKDQGDHRADQMQIWKIVQEIVGNIYKNQNVIKAKEVHIRLRNIL
jgi:hypothetical protein